MTALDLPALHEAWLTDGEVDQLFVDIEALAQPIEAIVKLAPRRRAPQTPWTFDSAHAALRAGDVRAVQLRYAYQGAQWWDTLTRSDRGIRLVRIQHDAQGPAAT